MSIREALNLLLDVNLAVFVVAVLASYVAVKAGRWALREARQQLDEERAHFVRTGRWPS